MHAPRSSDAGNPGHSLATVSCLGALLLLSLHCLTGCVIGDEVTYQPAPGYPSVPKDPAVLRQKLDDGVDLKVVGPSGSVWHLQMKGPSDGLVFDHVLVLYPDGRCFTTLDEERSGRGFEGSESSASTSSSEVRRAESNLRVLTLIKSGDSRRIVDLWHGTYLGSWPTMGRYSAKDGKIRVNVLECHGQYSTGIIMYDSTGVSQLVFVKSGGGYVLDQDESQTIWWSPEDNVGRLFRHENLTVNAVRSRVVTLRRVDGFVPPVLPAEWKW